MTIDDTVDIVDTQCQNNDELICWVNDYDESTCSENSDYGILDKHNKIINLSDIAWVKLKKAI